MAYFIVEDFAAGLDVRKSAVTARPGTLRQCENAFVNAGGELEKRGLIRKIGTFAAGSFGLAERDGSLVHFAKNDAVDFTVDAGVTDPEPVCIPLTTGAAASIQYVMDAESFGPNVFSAVLYDDGVVRYYVGSTETATGFTAPNFPLSVHTHRSKLYMGRGNVLRFSAIDNPNLWTSGTGSGLIDIAFAETGNPKVVNVKSYYDRLAILGERSVQVWIMDPDPLKNQLVETLSNVGAIGHQSAASYGTGDVLFLSNTGIRSVRARDSSNAAVLNDIGSPIDPIIQARNATITAPADTHKIIALVDPRTGHFWMIWGDTVYVLALYPNSKVTAWSTFKLDVAIDHATVVDDRIYLRSGHDLYEYTLAPAAATATIITPMLSANQPATYKTFTGIDLACLGHWKVEVCTDPLTPDAYNEVAIVQDSTYSLKRIAFNAYTTHVSLRLTTIGSEAARLGAIALHFEGGEAS